MQAQSTSWLERDSTPGVLLILAAAISFALLNSPLAEAAHHFFTAPLIGPHVSVHGIVNDGLMAVFFLYAGLELKRETVEGPFRNARTAALPLAGALGGMIAPALIYLALAPNFARGWAIPTATDIAFAIGVLALIGKRAPPGLRLFLLALAIIDDLGAILVIALFYAGAVKTWALIGAGVMFVGMLAMNRAGVRALAPYWLASCALWGFMLFSGVHATMAGVLAALAIPMRRSDGRSPLVAAEHALQPWVQLAIMPLFALINAGVTLHGFEAALHPIALGAGLGLFVGKPIGITLATLGVAALMRRPAPAAWPQLLGVGFIAGVGFTMSLFIGGLAFGAGDLAEPVRVGVLGGSLLAALTGLTILRFALRASGGDPELVEDEARAESEGLLDRR